MNWLKNLFKRKPRLKSFAAGEYAVEAFRHNGRVYYHFTDSFKIPAGRAICTLAIYEELRMRCTREYLEKHIRATELILNPENKRINLTDLAQINNNLKERLNLAPFPDHMYRLASIMFFDDTENPYAYDFAYNNEKKIPSWKKDPAVLDFFLRTQFQDLMPFSGTSAIDASSFFKVADLIDKTHHSALQRITSSSN